MINDDEPRVKETGLPPFADVVSRSPGRGLHLKQKLYVSRKVHQGREQLCTLKRSNRIGFHVCYRMVVLSSGLSAD